MLEARQKSVRVEELRNYGSLLRPLYTIAVEIEMSVAESPDTLHKILTDPVSGSGSGSGSGLVTRETVPFEVVSNFRGSAAGNKPFYSALVLHEGVAKRYEVAARDTGGALSFGTSVNYEPVVSPEELRLTHPAEFSRVGVEVLEWELHNYKHYFSLLVASKRYESFDLCVQQGEKKETLIKVNLAESELGERRVPCSWYLKRLSVVFSGLEREVRREIEFREEGKKER